MGRRRRTADQWMPPRVYRGRSAYEWQPHNGKTVRICDLGSSKDHVWREYLKIVNEINGKFTMNDIIDKFIVSKQFTKDIKDSTRSDYEDCIRTLRKVFGKAEPQAITSPVIQKFMDKRGETSEHRANREKFVLSLIWRWGIARGHIKNPDPTTVVRNFKSNKRDRYVTDEEYNAVYQVSSTLIQVAMEISYLCAARQGDVLDLKWEDITDEGIFIEQNKTGKQQIKLWTPRLKDAINKAKNLHNNSVASLYVIHNRKGQKYTASGFKTIWKRYRDKAGLKENFTFHDLKAKGISDYEEGDKQLFSGHKSRTQMEQYNRVPDKVLTIKKKRK